MTTRRAFIAGLGGAAVAGPLGARAQQPMPLLGFLNSASPRGYAEFLASFHKGLAETGFVEGQNVAIEYRWADGQYERLRAFADELARLRLAVLVANSPAALIAKAATTTIPIIFTVGYDPVENGLVPSLARPGGNLTGVSIMNVELAPKRLEFLREIVPEIKVGGLIFNPGNPNVDTLVPSMLAAAGTLGLQLHIQRASTEREIAAAFAEFVRLKAGGVVVGTDPFFTTQSRQLAALSTQYALPTIYQYREFAAAGGLISYGGSLTDVYRQLGIYSWPNSQRREAGRFASAAGHKGRTDHQSKDCQGTRPHRAAEFARPRRRGHRMTTRRSFIAGLTGAAVVGPSAAWGQQAIPVVGYLSASSAGDNERLSAFRAGLEEQGFSVNRNVIIEYRHAEGDYDRLAVMALELANSPVAVIMASALPSALAAQKATTKIPIVFVSGADPVQLGLVKSLARPDGNATGVSNFFGHLGGKRLALLRELVPRLPLIAYLLNPKNQNAEVHSAEVKQAADALSQPIEVLLASSQGEIETAFQIMVRQKAAAVLIGDDPFYSTQSDLIIGLAARYALPTMHYRTDYVAAGGLISYGSSQGETYRQAGLYTGRILKGEKPSDLPVVQPTKFELAINLKTAKLLGLTVPQTLLASADEVIE